MNGPERLSASEGRWVTRMGKCFPGERVIFRGRDLHKDLGRSSWISLYIYAVTGREFAAEDIRLIESMWVQTNYPDPRIWNNRVAALAGTVRSTGALGVSAALAVSEATIYGRRADLRAYGFLDAAHRRHLAGEPIQGIVGSEIRVRRGLPGYGRPIVSNDERIEYLMRILSEYKDRNFPTVSLALEIERIAKATRYRLQLNYAGLTAAVCRDLGLSSTEFYFMAYPVFLAGMVPCYLGAMERQSGTFYPLSCDRIEYNGPAERSWK